MVQGEEDAGGDAAASAGGARSSRAHVLLKPGLEEPLEMDLAFTEVGVGGEEVEGLAPSLGQPVQRDEECGESSRKRKAPFHRGVEGLLELGGDERDQAVEDLLLAPEVPVERWSGVAGGLGQLGQRGGGVPAPGKTRAADSRMSRRARSRVRSRRAVEVRIVIRQT